MPLSMRRQALKEKQRNARDEAEAASQSMAVDQLREGVTVTQVIRNSGISRGTCYRIKNALDNDDKALSRLMDPSKNRAGRPAVITKEEDQVAKSRLLFAASRGFAYNRDELRGAFAQITTDGRQGYRTSTGAPSDDTMRSWRAHNRDMTYRAAQNKTASKIQVDRYEHVHTLENALKSIQEKNEGIFDDSDRFRNLDETSVTMK